MAKGQGGHPPEGNHKRLKLRLFERAGGLRTLSVSETKILLRISSMLWNIQLNEAVLSKMLEQSEVSYKYF